MSEDNHDRLTIELPAEAQAVGTARLFATSVGRLCGIDDEVVEDVRLAVSEGVTDRIHAAGDPRAPVCVTAIVRAKDVVFEVSGAGPGMSDNGELGLAVVQSLFPDAEIERDPPLLRFVAPRTDLR